jgi:non-specific serine/threonine protein kinase/serine/threonine-protein kinase
MPKQIGPYRVQRELGRGGMGVVFLAWRDDQQFRKQVAIKILPGHLVDDQMRRRFRFERQTLANLEHPNIARLLDGGTTEHGEPYLVMEYVRGAMPIDRYCEEQQLRLADRIRLFRDVIAAVHYAHQHLVVHRDLKPSNILVSPEGVVKLVDFGIAKALLPTFLEEEPAKTVTGLHAMTPEFASPEQVRGEAIGTASDIYSLGVVLHLLLTGSLPFRTREQGMPELVREICEVEPPRLSTRVSRKSAASTSEHRETEKDTEPVLFQMEGRARLARMLAGDLDNIVLMALRKDPQRRYASAEQFSEDLGRYLDGLPVLARTDSFRYRASKFIRRNAGGVAAALLVLLAVAGGVTSTVLQAHRAEAERARAAANAAEANVQWKRAEELARLARQSQARAEQLAATARAKADEAERERVKAEARFRDVHKLATSFLFDFDRQIAPLAGSTQTRKMLVEKAQEYLERLSGDGVRDPQFMHDLAIAYYQIGAIQRSRHAPNLGDTQGALRSYHKALQIAERSRARTGNTVPTMRALATAYTGIADIATLQGDTMSALERYERALEWSQKVAAAEPANYTLRRDPMRLHGRIADMRMDLGQPELALAHYRKGLQAAEKLAVDFPAAPFAQRDLMVSHMSLGRYYSQQGDWDKARASFEQSLKLSEQMLGRSPENAQFARDVMVSTTRLARLWRGQNSPEQALPFARRGYDICRKLHQADPKNLLAIYDFAAANVDLGDTLVQLGRKQEAAENFRAAIDLAEAAARIDPQSMPTLAHRNMAHSALGSLLAANGEWAAAEQEFEKLISWTEEAVRAHSGDAPLKELAKRYMEAGDFHHRAGKSLADPRHLRRANELYSKAVTTYARLNDDSQSELLGRKLADLSAALR